MKEGKFYMRGEDTTTYGDATPWLQPGTPKGDMYERTQGGHSAPVDNPWEPRSESSTSGIIPRIRRR